MSPSHLIQLFRSLLTGTLLLCAASAFAQQVDTSKVVARDTTPPDDDNWTVHADMPAAQREKRTQALLWLISRDGPAGEESLDLRRATRFGPTHAENDRGIVTAARSTALLSTREVR